jgi:transposase InsO family protein
MVQTAMNETTEDGFFSGVGARHLIHDRDTKFSAAWRHVLDEAGVEPVPTPPRSPYLNGFAERWVRTVKRGCLRKMRMKTEADLRQALVENVRHYHVERPGNRPPDQGPGPPAQNFEALNLSQIDCRVSCGGAVRHYDRAAA